MLQLQGILLLKLIVTVYRLLQQRLPASLFLTVLLTLVHCSLICHAKPSTILDPGPDPNGRNLEEEIIYPFQQYIQVRKEYTVEHVPYYDDDHDKTSSASQPRRAFKKHPRAKKNRNPGSSEPFAASTSNRENSDAYNDHADNDDDYEEHGRHGKYVGEYESSDSHSHTKPRLREEITDHTKHEVYEEKGYGDSKYDHESHGYNSKSKEHLKDGFDHSHHNHVPSESRMSGRHHHRTRPSLARGGDGTSTKILEYAASNLYDRDAHAAGSIYNARSNIHCPEVIDFDLKSKKMGMGEGGNNPRAARGPRLQGLGAKISCLKNKWFGREPLPSAIFLDPSESAHHPIIMPTFNQFYKSIHSQVKSDSGFQFFR